MLARFRRLVHWEDGQDLVEYALLVALLSLVSMAALSILRGNLLLTFLRLVFELALS